MNNNIWSSSWLEDHVGRCLDHSTIKGVDYFNCCQWRRGANDAILKVDESTDWRSRLLMICSIKSKSEIVMNEQECEWKGNVEKRRKKEHTDEMYMPARAPCHRDLPVLIVPTRLGHCQSSR